MQRRQNAMRFVGAGICERVEVQALFRNFLGDVLERLDLGR
jgi:hypothetical protein